MFQASASGVFFADILLEFYFDVFLDSERGSKKGYICIAGNPQFCMVSGCLRKASWSLSGNPGGQLGCSHVFCGPLNHVFEGTLYFHK